MKQMLSVIIGDGVYAICCFASRTVHTSRTDFCRLSSFIDNNNWAGWHWAGDASTAKLWNMSNTIGVITCLPIIFKMFCGWQVFLLYRAIELKSKKR